MSRSTTRPTSIQKHTDRNWLRMFWLTLGGLALCSIGLIAFYAMENRSETPLEAQVPVDVLTQAGDHRNVQCALNLVVDSRLEAAFQSRMPLLRGIVGETLTTSYDENGPRFDPRQLPEKLRSAINEKLPARLQVREVLIQHLLVGLG